MGYAGFAKGRFFFSLGVFHSATRLLGSVVNPITKNTTAVIDYIYYDYTTTMVFATEKKSFTLLFYHEMLYKFTTITFTRCV